MVELFNAFVVDHIDPHSFTNEAAVTVRFGESSSVEGDLWVTYKRVLVELENIESNDPDYATTTISLSPVMALALVRRLVDVLYGSGLENLPPVYSRFTRELLNHLNGGEVDEEILDQITLIDANSSYAKCDGETLEDILPPSFR